MKNKYKLDHIVNPELNCIKYIKSYNQKKFTSHNYSDKIIRADYCKSLISIIFNTNNIEKTILVINKFLAKTNNPEEIQFCIKIDNEDKKFVAKFLKSLLKFNFNFIVLSSPKGRGFIDLWQWVNYLFKVSSKNSKFIMNISDEMYVEQNGWDKNLKKYIGLEEDDLYRLRTSVYRNRNYNDLWECGYAPDTTAIYTRKYISIQKDFSPCFGPDNGQQIVAYYLSTLNYPRHTQFLRDRVINDITFKGQGTNIGLTKEQLVKRKNINHLLWLNIFTYKNQKKYFQRSRKIQVEILKYKFKDAIFKEYYNKYIINFYTIDRKGGKVKESLYLSKNLSYLKLFFYNISRYDFFKYNTGYAKNKVVSILYTIFFLINKKFPEPKEEKPDKILESFIRFEENIYKFFNKRNFLEKKFQFYYKIYLSFLEKKKRRFFSWNLYNKTIKILKFIFHILNNLASFINFYLRLFSIFLLWSVLSLILILVFWKLANFIKYFINRLFIYNPRKNSYIVYTNNDQSKSLIIKGD